MKSLGYHRIALAAAALMASAATTSAQDGGIEVGVLSCASVPGSELNLLITSSVDILCEFKTPAGVEFYKGETGIGLGIDLDFGRNEEIHYAVISASADVRVGAYALEGKYVGGKASATVGAGVGVAALLGGGKRNISLQPFAVESSTGLGLAGGLTYLYLQRDPR
jgi:hypothetical protein